MINITGVFAIDGHDGAGKTTLARWLATSIGGSYQRPFHGALGAALLDAANHGNAARVIALGEEGIRNALTAVGAVRPVILDRSWMTVASLVDWETFAPVWHLWIPTVLCWADLSTTLDRLDKRTEQTESIDSHSHYLDIYRSLAKRTNSFVVRTDLNSTHQCHDILISWLKGNPSQPRIQL